MPMEVDFEPPKLGEVMAYRGVYVLGTVREADGKSRLTASHYCSCLVFGRSPVWGVWTAAGKFQRFYGFKGEIAEAYPHLTWRRKMAQWSLMAVDDLKPDARRRVLAERYKAKVPGLKTEAAE